MYLILNMIKKDLQARGQNERARGDIHDPGSGVDSKFLFCIGLKIGIWTLKKSISEKKLAVHKYMFLIFNVKLP